MKKVFLIRHAKAENLKEGLSDFSRSLVKEGMKESKDIAKKITDEVSDNMILISSPAHRALETAHIFAEKLNYPAAKILLKDSVYTESSSESFMTLLEEIEDTYDAVMLFGHNPGISEFASLLITEKDFQFDIPKSGILEFDFSQNSWKEIEKHTGLLRRVDYPKKYRNRFKESLNVKISQAFSELLNRINTDSSKNIQQSVEKHAAKIAKKFTKDLRRKTHEKSADQ